LKILAVCSSVLFTALAAHAQDSFADSVVSYVPGTGINSSYENSTAALGAPDSAAAITAPAFGNTNVVGIGDGGELTLEFDSPITNDPSEHADGMDFTIFGNQFFTLSGAEITGIYDHAGLTVWVSQNDSAFYQLVAPDGLPHGADDLFPTQGSGNPFLPVSPSFTLSSFTGHTSAYALSLYDGSAGGSSYSISWAEDASGDAVDLSSISYVRVEGSEGYGYIDAVSRVETVPEPSCAGLLIGVAAIGWLVARFRTGGRKRIARLSVSPRVMQVLAILFLAGHTMVRADTSYLLIQGPFGSGGAEETFQWRVNYQAGLLVDGEDLLTAVFGPTALDGSYMDEYGGTYPYLTASSGGQAMGAIDFYGSPFVISFTLNSTTVAQDPSYSPGWNYYVAGGGDNGGAGYASDGTWDYSNDGLDSRTLADGSFDAWVFGSTDNLPMIDGQANAPTAADFASATVVNIVPEPSTTGLLVLAAVGIVAACGWWISRRQPSLPPAAKA